MTRILAITFLAVAFLGCRDETSTGPHGGLTGIYVLRSVNGVPVPAAANGSGLTDFTIIADTIRVYRDGYATEVVVTSRPGIEGVQRVDQELQLSWGEGYVTFDAEYRCRDALGVTLASCIAPPHHSGLRSSFDLTFTYSVMYRVPMVFERVGPILPE